MAVLTIATNLLAGYNPIKNEYRTYTGAIRALLDEATSGDVIVIPAGLYYDANLLKDGVDLYFMPGAVVQNTTQEKSLFSTGADGANAAVTCNIWGRGVFIQDAPVADPSNLFHACFRIVQTNDNIYVECQEIRNKTPNTDASETLVNACNAIRQTAGSATFVVFGDIVCENSTAVQLSGTGTLKVTADRVLGGLWSDGTNPDYPLRVTPMQGPSFDVNGASCVLHTNVRDTVSAADAAYNVGAGSHILRGWRANGAIAIDSISNSVAAKFYVPVLQATQIPVNMGHTGTLEIFGADIIADADNNEAINCTAGTVRLRESKLSPHSGATYAATGTGTIDAQHVSTSKPLDPGLTVSAGSRITHSVVTGLVATATAGAATLSQTSGVITTEALTTAAAATYTLTLTNTRISSTSRVPVTIQNGTNTQGIPMLGRVTPGSGSVVITVTNMHASQALNGTLKISFDVF